VSIGQDAAGSGPGPPKRLQAEPQPQVEGSAAPPHARKRDPSSPLEPGRSTAISTIPEPGSVESTRVIAVVNQKGGVGKSTTAVNLGAALAEMGNTVLVIDLDPQGNASTGLGIDHASRDITTYQVLTGEVPPREAVAETPVPGLWAIPSTIDLAGAEIELVSQFSRETRLRRSVEELAGSFDFVFLDCPPSLGLLTVNALTAAGELIVPIQCEYYALEGLGQLLRNVRLVQQNLNSRLRLAGILLTMFDPRTRLSEQVVGEVRRYFGQRVYDAVIPRTVRLSEAPGFGLPITHYDPRSKGAAAYRTLAREVVERPVSGEPLPTGEPPRVVVSEAGPPPPEEEEEVSASSEESVTVLDSPGPPGSREGRSRTGKLPEAGAPTPGRPDRAAVPATEGGSQGPGDPVTEEDEQSSRAGGGPAIPAAEDGVAIPPHAAEERAEPPAEEPEWKGLGVSRGPGEREEEDTGGRQDDASGSRWRLFRRRQGGES
jgi:chromosome partitioning protein